MSEKLPGEFLRITETNYNQYKVEYVLDGKPHWMMMDTDFMVKRSEGAKQEIVRLREKMLSLPKDSKEVENIESHLHYALMESVWPEMYVAHIKGKDLNVFFEQNVGNKPTLVKSNPNNQSYFSFGIPVTKGKILATGKNGVVVSFNLRHLYLNKLYRSQLYSSDQKTLTAPISPHILVTDIYNFPSFNSIVDFAFAQQEYTAIVFINTVKLPFNDNLRIVFWFKRYPIKVEKDDDKIDLPDEAIPLGIALLKKEYLTHLGKPITPDIEKTITEETAKLSNLKSQLIGKNLWLTDTLNIKVNDLDYLDKNDDEIIYNEQKKGINQIWTKNKSQFCQFIKSEYIANPNQYFNLKDATYKLFLQYKFSFSWDPQKCYELVKKTP